MSVFIPRDLRVYLSSTTNYDVWLQRQVKQHDYTLRKIEQDESKAILLLKRENILKLQGLSHDIDLAKIE
jgi:hypothetical protein